MRKIFISINDSKRTKVEMKNILMLDNDLLFITLKPLLFCCCCLLLLKTATFIDC